jgi:hypothetical protein
MKQLVNLFFILIIPTWTVAATYYVSPTGSNSNNGLTQNAAFLTLQHAANQTAAGDIVFVLPGNYSGFTQTTSGTDSSLIHFIGSQGAIIDVPNTTNDGINLEGASYISVQGFWIYGMPRAGLRAVHDTGVVFSYNIIDSCGMWGILTGFSKNVLIEGNECSRSVVEHGIYVGNSSDNPVIRNNHCWGNNANGIHMNGDVSLQPGDGIISNALVENNLIHDNGNAGGSGINCDAVQNSIIRNNLLYNNHASGISLYKIDGGGGSINNLVVNNTIVQPTITRWALNISDGSTGNTVFNNIFYSDHSFRGSISIDAGSLPGFQSDYNALTNRMSNNGGSSTMTLVQWQQATGHDAHSVLATPAQLFVNSAGSNYHLSSTSPARNAGTGNLGIFLAPINDIESNNRPLEIQWDMGAHEFDPNVGVDEIQQASWNELSSDALVNVYDLAGRLLFSGNKSSAAEFFKNNFGIYVIRPVGKPGFLFPVGKR